MLQSEAKNPDVSLNLRVVMMWPHPGTRRVCFEDLSSEQTCRNFEVIFAGKCFRLWNHLDIAVNDHLLLSLRGSTFVHKALGAHNTVKLPFELIYDDGCVVNFITRKGLQSPENIVDIWKSTCVGIEPSFGLYFF